MQQVSDLIQLQPRDQHNEKLEQNVHPPDWANPQPAGRYNLVVIGAGTAGLVAAAGAAGLGAKVALIERELMGGDCLNVGCVPSKGVISAARIAAAVRAAGEFGVEVPDGVRVNFAAVMERMRRLRAGISPHDSAARFRDLGIDVFLGTGKFVDGHTVEVGDARLAFKKAVIATGARAAAPPIPGLDQVPYLTNESVFSLTELPARLGVIGAGPIGCELAQSFARFGSEVYLVESTHGILPREDPDAAAFVKQSMLRDGVKLLCCGRNTVVAQDGDKIRLQLTSHDEGYDVEVDQLLVAAGRAPNVASLNLAAAGVQCDKSKGIEVNDRLQTTNRHIYAAGDICSPYKFTHAADFMARIVIQNAIFLGRAQGQHAHHPLGNLHVAGDRPCRAERTRCPTAKHRHQYVHAAVERRRSRDTRRRDRWLCQDTCAERYRQDRGRHDCGGQRRRSDLRSHLGHDGQRTRSRLAEEVAIGADDRLEGCGQYDPSVPDASGGDSQDRRFV